MGHYNKPDEHSREPRENLGAHPSGLIIPCAVSPAVGSYGVINQPAQAPAGARAGGWSRKNGYVGGPVNLRPGASWRLYNK